MANNIFDFHNEVHLRGKIFDIVEKKYYTDFFLSCGNNGREYRFKKRNGQYSRDTINVRFFKTEAKTYPKQFKIGDRVTVTAVLQNIVDRHTQRGKHLEVWGLNMMSVADDKAKDLNNVQYRGRIVSAKAINDNYIIINVKTVTKKKIKNTRENTKFPFIEKEFVSSTATGMRFPNGGAKDLVYTKYTPGTWVDMTGTVQGRKNAKTGKHTQRFVAEKVNIIGEVQKINLRNQKI